MTIVEELRTNRESGAKRLEAEYKAGLMTLARRFCTDEGDAEELVNRTFAAVVAGIDDYLEQSAFFGWMCQILTNIHAKDVRKKMDGLVVYPGGVPDVEDQGTQESVVRELDASLLHDAVEELPPDMREAIVLHYFTGLSIPKIAKFLAIPEGTVKSRLHYARLALGAKLGATVKTPGGKALLFALVLAALTVIGAAVVTAVGGGNQSTAIDGNREPSTAIGSRLQSVPDDDRLQSNAGSRQPTATGDRQQTYDLRPTTFDEQPPTGETMNATKATRTLAAASLVLAATAQATDLCYRLPSATPYTWDGGIWITHTNKVVHGAVPTASDNVFIWGTGLKADENDAGKPLCVASGEVALTKNFTIGWNGVANSSSSNKILFEIQDGGVMTNAGPVKLGVVEDGYTKQTNPGGLATVRAGGSWVAQNGVTVGTSSTGNRNRIVIERGGEMDAVSGSGAREFIVANKAGHNACVTNAGTLAAYDFFVGGYGNGDFENSGDFTVSRKLTIGRQAGSYGHVRHSAGTFSKGTPSSQPLYVGYSGIGVFEVFAPLSLQRNERLILGSQGTGEGTLILGTGGTIGNVTNVLVGANSDGGRGHLRMAGGTLTIQLLSSGYQLFVGKINSSGTTQKAWGEISGHGMIARDTVDRSLRLKLYGQVCADGGDLNLGSVKTVGDKGVDANKCGSNGWYAVNGGRLLYPASQDFSYPEHATIGDYVYRGGGEGSRTDPMDITLVNALQLRLYDANGDQQVDNGYNYAALYAPDRNDIPGRLPGSAPSDVTLGVWRLGHFDAPGDDGFASAANAVSFGKAWLRFRIDENAIPVDVDWSQQKVRLYHWDGSSWKTVGKATPGTLPYIETASAQPAYAGVDADGLRWNIGWYAARLVRNGGFTLIVR